MHEVPLEVYEELEQATPEQRRAIILRLIEEHPRGKLELPERDGVSANLSLVDLSRDALREIKNRSSLDSPAWWDPMLEGANLEGAKLQHANLWEADLQHAFLGAAKLQHAFLEDAKLQHANLWGADLQHANLKGADLPHAFLGVAKLQYALLWGADLQHADLSRADLTRVSRLDVRSIERIYLYRATLDHTQLTKRQLRPHRRKRGGTVV